ncbi:MAG: N-acetylmuramoyl-L-alanine amidase [Dysgonomonas mossii]|uniref:N-acetylmuramoyl-L-alanine amidase family protein n=2 Tax=Dysgonomonas mossii TaxID=163665 RepID=UPI001DCDFBD9|nr:N-acetylmuramoyl-L-alanine amidase [Dysgonomonas mossii]MBS5795706.1 N-acetylmuramoyl-L-alanine amidase [Dysgonomonas mossii]MBS7110678.1 N-acetylmuramoyl-L-alanine amidase [Dysgonomonas mossii]
MNKVLSLLILLFIANVTYAIDSRFVVVIDAGHGGKDTGATRGGYKEKDINLGVVLALGQLIERNHKDVKVVYTRKSDVFVDLDKRADIANKAKANLFISVHTNSTAAKSTTVSGADTYILGLARSEENLQVAKRENSVILLEDNYKTKYEGFDPNSPESYIIFEFMTNTFMEQSLQFASFVQSDFRNVAKRVDRGVRQAGFLVLRKTSAPSVLIELGFINNQSEAQFLSTKSGQQSMATAIYSGFRKYKRDFDKKQGKLVVESTEVEDISFDDVEEETITVKNDQNEDRISQVSVSEKARNNTASSNKKIEKDQIEYRVQFLVSPRKLSGNSPALKGLSPVSFYKDGSVYRYTYGSTTNFNEITKIQNQVRLKFKDAFVIRMKNGKRIK